MTRIKFANLSWDNWTLTFESTQKLHYSNHLGLPVIDIIYIIKDMQPWKKKKKREILWKKKKQKNMNSKISSHLI